MVSVHGTIRITGSSNTDIAEKIKAQTGTFATRWNETNRRIQTIEETMCRWAQPELGDTGEGAYHEFWQAALVAVTLLNTAAQISISKKQYQIAKDYAEIAKDQWRRFRDAYAPLERAMVNEITNTPEPKPDYDGAKSRGNSFTNSAFLTTRSAMTKLAKRYALCVDPSLYDDMLYAEAITADDSVNFNYRDEEYFAHVMSDVRWNRRSSLLNLGRDILATSVSYADAANKMLGDVSGMLNQGAQGAMGMLGYLQEHRNTMYPMQFSMASPLVGATSQAFGGANYIGSGPVSWQ